MADDATINVDGITSEIGWMDIVCAGINCSLTYTSPREVQAEGGTLLTSPHALNGRMRLIKRSGTRMELVDLDAYQGGVRHDAVQSLDEINRVQARDNIQARATDPTFGSLVNHLKAGLSCGLAVCGDSTGNSPTEWVGLLASELAARYPTHGVYHDVINTGTGNYDRTVLQAAPDGDRYWQMYTANHHNLVLGDVAVPMTSGDLDVACKVRISTWSSLTSITGNDLLAQYGATGDRKFRIYTSQTKILGIAFSADGTNLTTLSTTVDAAYMPYADDEDFWFRVTLDTDNGAGSYELKFWHGVDGQTWTQLGSTKTGAAFSSLFDAGASYSMSSSSRPMGDSRFYECRIRDGIDGPIVNPLPVDVWHKGSSSNSATLVGSPILTITNYSWSGRNTAQAVGIDFDQLFSNHNTTNFFVSLSHNDSYSGSYTQVHQWLTGIESIVNAMQGRMPQAYPVLVSQNPKTTYTTNPASIQHSLRCTAIGGWAYRHGYGHIDAHSAFLSDSRGLGVLNDPDGTHPSEAGSQLWSSVCLRRINDATPAL